MSKFRSFVNVTSAIFLAGMGAISGTVFYKTKIANNHTHSDGFAWWQGGRLIEAVVEQDGKFFEVWGLVCECGFVDPDETFAGGAHPTIGPATAWMNKKIENLSIGPDKSQYREYILDIRSDQFKPAVAKEVVETKEGIETKKD